MVDDYARPRFYTFVDELPYTATGKKQRYILRNRVVEDSKEGKLIRVSKI
jgi:acyl-coenzyme A synthetase/AMP-(fatty) acid ligase